MGISLKNNEKSGSDRAGKTRDPFFDKTSPFFEERGVFSSKELRLNYLGVIKSWRPHGRGTEYDAKWQNVRWM